MRDASPPTLESPPHGRLFTQALVLVFLLMPHARDDLEEILRLVEREPTLIHHVHGATEGKRARAWVKGRP
jgi:hypothetical protein